VNRQPRDIGPDDATLVPRARRGDPDAFAELMARYQDRVYNTCYRLCGDEADALDLTQATFLRALESLSRFEARASFYTWLFRIAVNLALSARRQRRRRPTVPLADPDDSRLARQDRRSDPAQEIDVRETYAQVQAALERLEPEFRAAVVLKDIEDLDYATIAEILEVPIGTVKSRIYRGRTMLRALLLDERTERGRRPA
jgi:RNA polymerase sigma-70 factor (ECF subfamily)